MFVAILCIYILCLVPPFSSLWPCFAGAYVGFGLAGLHAGRLADEAGQRVV